jgi:hypothetical protein
MLLINQPIKNKKTKILKLLTSNFFLKIKESIFAATNNTTT